MCYEKVENYDMKIIDFFAIYENSDPIEKIVKATAEIYIAMNIFEKSNEQIRAGLAQYGDAFEDYVNNHFNI